MVTPDTINLYIYATPLDLTDKMKYSGTTLAYQRDNFCATLSKKRYLIISFSCPKIIYGNNYKTYDCKDSQLAKKLIYEFVSDVLINPSADLSSFGICRLDVQNNLSMNKNNIKHYFDVLNKTEYYHNTKKAVITDYYEGNQTGKAIGFKYNKFNIYDKNAEVNKNNNLQSQNLKTEYLRFEPQLRKENLKKYRKKYGLTLDKILDSDKYVTAIFIEEMQKYGLCNKILNKKSYFKLNRLDYNKIIQIVEKINDEGMIYAKKNSRKKYVILLMKLFKDNNIFPIYSYNKLKSIVDDNKVKKIACKNRKKFRFTKIIPNNNYLFLKSLREKFEENKKNCICTITYTLLKQKSIYKLRI